MTIATYHPGMPEKDIRFGFVWTKAEAEALKEWCWQNRIKSESGAVRALISDGLKRAATPEIIEASKSREKKK